MLNIATDIPKAAARHHNMGKEDQSPLIRDFLNSLEERGVRFCHWKSNMRLKEMLAGGDDIDLLVHRSDSDELQAVMADFGFKHANPRAGMEHPGIFHALSIDGATGKLVHLHVYHQIVSGDSLVKNYRLRVEDLLLDDTRHLEGVRIPRPDVELMLFVMRIALKHVSAIELWMINRTYHSVVDELSWLQEQTSPAAAADLCHRTFPSISSSLFLQALEILSKDGNLFQRLRISHAIAQRMRGSRRLGVVRTVSSRLRRTIGLGLGKIWRKQGKILQSGGMVVALVGPKATGKSTLGNELANRLGKQLFVKRIHAGKPQSTLLTFLPRMMIPLARKLLRSERSSEYQKVERREKKQYSLIHVFHMLMLAYERRVLLLSAARQAAAGAIVVSDRYPSVTIGATDSSSFDDSSIDRCRSRMKKWMMRQERKIYDSIPRPDLIIRLEAPISLTTLRDAERIKPGGPDAQALERRWQLETMNNYRGAPEVVVRTDRSIEETAQDVVSTVWRKL